MSVSAATAVDLRVVSAETALTRAERSLGVRLDRNTEVRKRRSIGAQTNRGTWVRVERRALERIDGQGWNGTECAAVLHGVSMPEWLAGAAWRELEESAMWRADETELIEDQPVRPADRTSLPESWWSTLNASLDALADQRTTRVATPDTVTITEENVSRAIHRAFPEIEIDTSISEWVAAHADLSWANLTTPNCFLLDWEDWGMAPRGLDASTLWLSSLDLPDVTDRVRHERREDLGSRTGRVMSLFCCSKLIPYVDRESAIHREALRLIGELQDSR